MNISDEDKRKMLAEFTKDDRGRQKLAQAFQRPLDLRFNYQALNKVFSKGDFEGGGEDAEATLTLPAERFLRGDFWKAAEKFQVQVANHFSDSVGNSILSWARDQNMPPSDDPMDPAEIEVWDGGSLVMNVRTFVDSWLPHVKSVKSFNETCSREVIKSGLRGELDTDEGRMGVLVTRVADPGLIYAFGPKGSTTFSHELDVRVEKKGSNFNIIATLWYAIETGEDPQVKVYRV